jgi:hypothetical protein
MDYASASSQQHPLLQQQSHEAQAAAVPFIATAAGGSGAGGESVTTVYGLQSPAGISMPYVGAYSNYPNALHQHQRPMQHHNFSPAFPYLPPTAAASINQAHAARLHQQNQLAAYHQHPSQAHLSACAIGIHYWDYRSYTFINLSPETCRSVI